MFCPNCGTKLKAYKHYNPKTNKWNCDCGVAIEEKFDFEEKCWKLKLYYGGEGCGYDHNNRKEN